MGNYISTEIRTLIVSSLMDAPLMDAPQSIQFRKISNYGKSSLLRGSVVGACTVFKYFKRLFKER